MSHHGHKDLSTAPGEAAGMGGGRGGGFRGANQLAEKPLT